MKFKTIISLIHEHYKTKKLSVVIHINKISNMFVTYIIHIMIIFVGDLQFILLDFTFLC